MLKSIMLVVVLILPGHMVRSQSVFSLGVASGPAYSVTSFSGSSHDQVVKPAMPSRINYHLGITAQYLIKDVFGVETGLNVATKNIRIKELHSESLLYANLDSFSFPFLLTVRLSYPKSPFRKLNFLLGTVIEYQNFLESSEKLTMHSRISGYVPSMTLGSRISFRQGTLGRIDLGCSYNHALKPYYSYNLADSVHYIDVQIRPLAHFFKLELIYFFLNTHMKEK